MSGTLQDTNKFLRRRTVLLYQEALEKLLERARQFGEVRKNQGLTVAGKRKLGTTTSLSDGSAYDAFNASLPYGGKVMYDSSEYAKTQPVFDALVEEEEEDSLTYIDDYFQIIRPDGLLIALRARRVVFAGDRIDYLVRPYKLEAVVLNFGSHFINKAQYGERPYLEYDQESFFKQDTGLSYIKNLKNDINAHKIIKRNFPDKENQGIHFPLNSTFSFAANPSGVCVQLGNDYTKAPVSSNAVDGRMRWEPSYKSFSRSEGIYRSGFLVGGLNTASSPSNYKPVLQASYNINIKNFQGNLSGTETFNNTYTPFQQHFFANGTLYVAGFSQSTGNSSADKTSPSFDCQGVGRTNLPQYNIFSDFEDDVIYMGYSLRGSEKTTAIFPFETNVFVPQGNATAFCYVKRPLPFNRLKHNPGGNRYNTKFQENYELNFSPSNFHGVKSHYTVNQTTATVVSHEKGLGTHGGAKLQTVVINDSGSITETTANLVPITSSVSAEPGVAYEIYGRQLWLNTHSLVVVFDDVTDTNYEKKLYSTEIKRVPCLYENWTRPVAIAWTSNVGEYQANEPALPLQPLPTAGGARYRNYDEYFNYVGKGGPVDNPKPPVILHVQETDQYFFLPENGGKRHPTKFVEWTTIEAGVVFHKYGDFNTFLSDPFVSAPFATDDYLLGAPVISAVTLASFPAANEAFGDKWYNAPYFPVCRKNFYVNPGQAPGGFPGLPGMGYPNSLEDTPADRLFYRDAKTSLNFENCAKARKKLGIQELVLHIDNLGQLYRVKTPKQPGGGASNLPGPTRSDNTASSVEFESPTFLPVYSLFDVLGILPAYRVKFAEKDEYPPPQGIAFNTPWHYNKKKKDSIKITSEELLPRIIAVPRKNEGLFAAYFTKEGVKTTAGGFKLNLGNV